MDPTCGTLARMIFNMVRDDYDPRPTIYRCVMLISPEHRRDVAKAMADDFRRHSREDKEIGSHVIIGWLAGIN
jgi:hypothetical protein